MYESRKRRKRHRVGKKNAADESVTTAKRRTRRALFNLKAGTGADWQEGKTQRRRMEKRDCLGNENAPDAPVCRRLRF